MGLPTGCLVTFFSYVPRCLYPDTYPEVSTMSSRPALPFPRPVESKRSLCDPVNLVVSVRRLTVGEATALWEDIWVLEDNISVWSCGDRRNKTSDIPQPYRDSWNDGRLPLYQLEDLSLGLLSALLFVLLPGQLCQRSLELIIRDVATGFLPKKWVQRERLITQHKHWQLSLTCLAALSAGLHRGLSARLKSSECRRSHVIASTRETQHAAGRRHPAG